MGRLDKALDEANKRGWLVVDEKELEGHLSVSEMILIARKTVSVGGDAVVGLQDHAGDD